MSISELKKYNHNNLKISLLAGIGYFLFNYIYSIAQAYGHIIVASVCCIIIFLSAIISILYFFISIHFIAVTSLSLRHLDIKELDELLKAEDAIEYKKQRIYLTSKYLIAVHIGGIRVLEYKDIAWMYPGEKYRYFSLNEKRSCLIFHTMNHKQYKSSGILQKYGEELGDVMVSIIDRAPDILTGYTYENNCRYKAIVNK